MICHYWYFLEGGYKYEAEACIGRHDTSLMVYDLENIAIVNIKGVDYRCLICNMSRSDAITLD